MRRPSSSNSSAAEVIEMPRSCSSAIQSEVACRRAFRPADRAGQLDGARHTAAASRSASSCRRRDGR